MSEPRPVILKMQDHTFTGVSLETHTYVGDPANLVHRVVVKNQAETVMWATIFNFVFEGRSRCGHVWTEDNIQPSEERECMLQFFWGYCCNQGGVAGVPTEEDTLVKYSFDLELGQHSSYFRPWAPDQGRGRTQVTGSLLVPRGTDINFCIHFNIVKI